MNKNKSPSPYLLFIVDLILLNFSFFAMNYLKRGTLKLSSPYIKLLIVFYIIWMIVSLLTKKFHMRPFRSYFGGLFLYAKSIIFIAYGISLMVVLMGLTAFSRLHIFGACLMFFIIEIFSFTGFYLTVGNVRIKLLTKNFEGAIRKQKISIFLFISDFLIISFSFFIMNFYKRETFNISYEYEKLLLIVYGLWLFFSIITRKFDKSNFQNYHYAMAACTKSAILMVATMSLAIFAFRLFHFSRLQIFGTFLLLILFEAIIYYLYFIFEFGRNTTGDVESIEELKDFYKQKKIPVETREVQERTSAPSFMNIIIDRYLCPYPHFFEFIKKTIDLSKIKDSEAAIMNFQDISDIEILNIHSLRLLINFYRLNDIRWINRYFLEVHKKLSNRGYFIGRSDTIETHKKKFFEKYPKFYAEVFYIFYFIFFRVFPKLPELRKIYFALTKGKNRIISKAELMGRLYFCGFRVLAEQEIGGSVFFIAQKVKTPSLDQSPSYSPLVKLKRIGLNGQIIFINKFRTMYPYSEYLQEDIFQNHKLEEGGKIKDDFRVTEWGWFMRKYWLDELPMIFNWIKGEVKIFGVRPLSMHYLDLYDSPLREMRKRVKPGIIPPFYADLPGKFEEIIESERKYFQAYFKHPLRTQFIYFFKALNNIIIKGARSG